MTGSFGLISLLFMFPDYCLVNVVGINAAFELTQFTLEQDLCLLIPDHLS